MAEVLSQSQIDELLNSMRDDGGSSGAAKPAEKKSEDKHKKYDFASPKKFTKDKLKLLKGIYDNYARLVSLRLNGVLRAVCEVEVDSVEEQRYFEFNNMLGDTDIMMTMDVIAPGESKEMPIMFHISPKLSVNMIDRMLGGFGDDVDVDMSYEYTEIEVALYEKLMKYMLEVTYNAWHNYVVLDIQDEKLEENPGLFQSVSLDEPVVIVLLNIKMNEVEGKLTICIPGTLLTDIFVNLDKRKYVDTGYSSVAMNNREKIMDSLSASALQVTAKLGDAILSMEDIYSLKVGDVIDLNKPKDSNVTLYVEEQPWFEGIYGVHNKNTAVQILNRIEPDEEEPEQDAEEMMASGE